jgi:hypothetical protein
MFVFVVPEAKTNAWGYDEHKIDEDDGNRTRALSNQRLKLAP